MVPAVESDVALVTTVLRVANRVAAPRAAARSPACPQAVEVLTPEGVERLAQAANVFDFFERIPGWDAQPERFRLHAVATQAAADRVGRELDYDDRDQLLTSALLHDIGKLVLVHAYPAYPEQIHGNARTPEERVHAERRELGVDHGLVGGVLARRWGLPGLAGHAPSSATTPTTPTGEAAIVRLADMLAHYGHGGAVDPKQLLNAARALELGPEQLRNLMYEIPYSSNGKKRHVDPVPAVQPRAGRAQEAGRGQGLQADRGGARALHQHGAHAPAQHLRQARDRRPRSGRAAGHRPRLAVAPDQQRRRAARPRHRSPRRAACPSRPSTNVWWNSSLTA